MAKFLTTIELSYQIQQVIKTAQKEIILVSPYLKLSPNLKDSLSEADGKGIDIILIYGKSELDKVEQHFLDSLENLTVYYHENLHGKCYFNESIMLITSMNLHEFSEKRNKEFGIFIDSEDDSYIYEDAIDEMRLLLSSSQLQKENKSHLQGFKSFLIQKPAIEEFCNYLNAVYGVKKFVVQKIEEGFGNRSTIIVSQDFISNVKIEIGTNIDFILNISKPICERIFNLSKILTNPELVADYRVYWNPPYNMIKVYDSIPMRDKWSLLENPDRFKYHKRAIDLVISELKQDFQKQISNT